MNHLKKIFLAAVLGVFGAVGAFAQCTATSSATSQIVRQEGTVEAIANIIVSCAAAPAAAGSTLSVSISPNTATIAPGSTTPDNKSTFPFPILSGGPVGGPYVAIPLTPPNVTVSGNTVVFSFTPNGADQEFQISGLRTNINASGLPVGGVLIASAVGGGGLSIQANTLIVGVVQTGLATGTGTGWPTTALNIASCGPAVTLSSSKASAANVLIGDFNGHLTTTTGLTVTLKEGFVKAWKVKVDEDSGSTLATQGTRLLVTLTGIPSGVTVYAPELISAVSGGTAAGVGQVTNGAVLTMVSGSVAADGSAGTVLAGPIADQWDKLTATSGTVTIVYEVTTEDTGTAATAPITIALVGKAPVGAGAISGSFSFAPVGSPSAPPANAALPQFAAGTAKVVANVNICATYLLFPYVVNTGDGAYDTGFAISNTTADVPAIGTTAQSGDVTFYFFPANGGTAPSPVTVKSGLAGGQQATYVLSSLGSPFSGYVIAVCNFQLGHGFAFINSPQPGTGGQFAEGYLALSVSNPRIPGSTGGALATPIESAAH
jgi:hypothetical protein